jgi:hypothetical protein
MALWIALSAVVLLVVAALVMQSITGKSYIQPMTDSEEPFNMREMSKALRGDRTSVYYNSLHND